MSKKIMAIVVIINIFFLFTFAMHIAYRSEIIVSTASERIEKLKNNNELLFILHLYFDNNTSDLLLKNIAENEKDIKESERIMQVIETHKNEKIKNIIRAGHLNDLMTKAWKKQKKMAEMINKKIIEEEQQKQEVNARRINRAFFLSKKHS